MKKWAWLVAALAIGLCACSDTESSAAAGDCPALVGPEPWLVLFGEDYRPSCAAVGLHQDVQIWNKGFDSLTLEWQGAVHEIGSDEKYSTGPLGEIVGPGEYPIESSPYAAPALRVVDPDQSFSAQTELDLDGFGAIELGMTLREASEASGQDIVVDVNLAPGPDCWHAVIPGDPYSPIFTVAGRGNDESVIEFITTFYPSDAAATVGTASATVPSQCG